MTIYTFEAPANEFSFLACCIQDDTMDPERLRRINSQENGLRKVMTGSSSLMTRVSTKVSTKGAKGAGAGAGAGAGDAAEAAAEDKDKTA